jgi:hypothetical protein
MNNTGQGANSYKYFNYFSKQVTEITVKTTIDLIKLSNIDYHCSLSIHDKLTAKGYTRKYNYRLDEGKHTRISRYIKDKSIIDFLHKHRCQYEYGCNDVLILHSPDAEVIETVDTILSGLYIDPKMMKMELAFDFFLKGISTDEFKDIIRKHLFLSYQRSESFNYKNTFYTNNVRKSTKGIRLYPEKITGGYPVRVELEIHRTKIKDLNIPFPVTDKSLEIDFTKMFCFRKIDTEKFIKAEVKKKKNRHAIAMANIRRPKMGQIILRTIEAYADHIDSDSLMESIEKLKDKDHGVDNYYRFLVDMKEETALINEAVKRQGFVREKFSFEKHGGFYRL